MFEIEVHYRETDSFDSYERRDSLGVVLHDLEEARDCLQSAKELYKSLGLNITNWSKWAERNIESNPFAIQGLDYEALVIMTNGREFSNYLLSIDFAKKLAMQVRTEEGEQVRDYFLECEDRAKQAANPQPVLPATYLEALKALVNSEEEKVAIQHQLTVAAPKLEYYEQVLDQNELYTISEVAKKNGITAQELNKILLAGGIYDKRSNGKTFKTDFMDKGYGKMITARTGHTQAKLTIKGEVFVTTVAMKSKLAVEILEARKAKSAKTAHRPLKLDQDQKEARSKHTINTINTINKLIN